MGSIYLGMRRCLIEVRSVPFEDTAVRSAVLIILELNSCTIRAGTLVAPASPRTVRPHLASSWQGRLVPTTNFHVATRSPGSALASGGVSEDEVRWLCTFLSPRVLRSRGALRATRGNFPPFQTAALIQRLTSSCYPRTFFRTFYSTARDCSVGSHLLLRLPSSIPVNFRSRGNSFSGFSACFRRRRRR